MGRNNQQRRAAKRRERAQREAPRHASARSPGPPSGPRLGGEGGGPFRFGVDGHGTGHWGAARIDEEAYARNNANQILQGLIARVARVDGSAFIAQLLETSVVPLTTSSRQILDEQLTLRLLALLANLWEHGWQPADLVHVASRVKGPYADLVAALIGEQARRTSAQDRAPAAWRSQLAAVESAAAAAGLTAARPSGLLAVAAQTRAGTGLIDAWAATLRLAAQLEALPVLGLVIDPPSSWGPTRRAARPAAVGSDRGKVMAKISALLAKAEATDYPAEAEALSGKAQDLMTRHAIDEALLHASDEALVDVVSLRVHIHSPYAGEKVGLLNQVAMANRAKLVWHDTVAIATLVGTPVDVDQVELLFTSLLIQATRAMAEAGAVRPGSFDRSSSFRRSFLASYGVRIGERLAEATDAATSTYGKELVPVLARQATAVEDEFARLFPHIREKASATRYSQRGWQAGRDAADQATFLAGRIASA